MHLAQSVDDDLDLIRLEAIGVCGVDDSTDLTDVIRTQEQFPFLEFGVLFRQQLRGTPRYPSEEKLNEIFTLGQKRVEEKQIWNFCGHLCGRDMRNILAADPKGHELLDLLVKSGFKRVQFNPTKNNGVEIDVTVLDFYHQNLRTTFEKYNGKLHFILQCNDETEFLWQEFLERPPENVVCLMDESKGLGIKPDKRPPPAAMLKKNYF